MNRLSFLLSVLLFTFSSHALPPSYSAAEKNIFEQLNQERVKAGLPALEWNDLAADAARRHARMLSENGELSHQYAGEPSLPERLGATGARFTNAAENVARTEVLEDVHPALMNSSGHRANMLNPAYNAVGIGVVEKKGRLYVTQDFLFLVPVYSEEQFGAALAETVHAARKSLEARADSYLHDLACSTDGNAANLSARVTGKYLVVFSSSDPHRLPERVLHAVSAPDYFRMNFGACFRPDKEHGYGNFWVVAAFQGS